MSASAALPPAFDAEPTTISAPLGPSRAPAGAAAARPLTLVPEAPPTTDAVSGARPAEAPSERAPRELSRAEQAAVDDVFRQASQLSHVAMFVAAVALLVLLVVLIR